MLSAWIGPLALRPEKSCQLGMKRIPVRNAVTSSTVVVIVRSPVGVMLTRWRRGFVRWDVFIIYSFAEGSLFIVEVFWAVETISPSVWVHPPGSPLPLFPSLSPSPVFFPPVLSRTFPPPPPDSTSLVPFFSCFSVLSISLSLVRPSLDPLVRRPG